MLPLYHVILMDCDCHSQEQVDYALHYLCGLSKEVAYQKMLATHTLGRTIVGTYHEEAAAFFVARLRSVISQTTGLPLKVDIEPA
jgi:ATP-dependent Clp protease adapter protein ClpS